MPCSIGASRRSGDDELTTVNTDGSRSSVASSTWRAMRDHLEHVAVALGAEAVAVRHLVGEREHVERRLEVAHRPVQVDRLDRVAADEVDDVEASGTA